MDLNSICSFLFLFKLSLKTRGFKFQDMSGNENDLVNGKCAWTFVVQIRFSSVSNFRSIFQDSFQVFKTQAKTKMILAKENVRGSLQHRSIFIHFYTFIQFSKMVFKFQGTSGDEYVHLPLCL